MRVFTVLCRVDAYVDYRAAVVAETPEQAARMAKDHPDRYRWDEEGPVEFDVRGYVTLNDDGCEVDSSKVGYFG